MKTYRVWLQFAAAVIVVNSFSAVPVRADILTAASSIFEFIGSTETCVSGDDTCDAFTSPVYTINPGDTLDFGTVSFGPYAVCGAPRDSTTTTCVEYLGALGMNPGGVVSSCSDTTGLDCLGGLVPASSSPQPLVFTNDGSAPTTVQVTWNGPLTENSYNTSSTGLDIDADRARRCRFAVSSSEEVALGCIYFPSTLDIDSFRCLRASA